MTMEYRLAALDMDGTLLNTDHEITTRTCAVIERVARAGKTIALSTGRAMSELWTHLERAPGITYVIGESGACIYDVRRGKTLRRIAMEPATVDAVLTAADGVYATLQCFIDDQSYLSDDSDDVLTARHLGEFIPVYRAGSLFVADLPAFARKSAGKVSKINLFFARREDRERYSARIADLHIPMKESVGIGLELSQHGVDKASGLRFLCDHLGISLSQVMAVGDSDNDLDIMGVAGLAVAMGNAIDEVRAMAHAITDDCDHDGAAKAMEKYMLP